MVDAYLNAHGVPYEAAGVRVRETKSGRGRNELSHQLDRKVQPSEIVDRVTAVVPEFRDHVRAAIVRELYLPT